MWRVLIFGTGKRCDELLDENENSLEKCEILAFVDNNTVKQGDYYKGKKIIAPSEIYKYDYDFIYLASSFYEEIYEQLVNEYNIPKNKIKKDNYFGIMYGLQKRKEHYKNMNMDSVIYDNSDVASCKIVIYTAIFGEYDDLKTPKYIDENADYYCFTDNPTIRSDVWKIIYVKNIDKDIDPRRAAKIYKVLPHKFFPEYSISIWVDGSMLIKGDLRKYIKDNMKHSNILFCPHPWRNCIYHEADYAMRHKWDDIDIIRRQIMAYKEKECPENVGLISAGFMVRRHNEADVMAAMNMWWKEICEYSSEDQISFNYVAWYNKLKYDVSPLWIYDNQYIRVGGHLK